MIHLKKINDEVKDRLIKFLLKDKIGIRKSVIWLFLQTKSCNTAEIYDYLIKQGFDVNYRAVSSMVGQMHSRLGILRFNWTNKGNVYSIREDYLDIVKLILIPFSGRETILS